MELHQDVRVHQQNLPGEVGRPIAAVGEVRHDRRPDEPRGVHVREELADLRSAEFTLDGVGGSGSHLRMVARGVSPMDTLFRKIRLPRLDCAERRSHPIPAVPDQLASMPIFFNAARSSSENSGSPRLRPGPTRMSNEAGSAQHVVPDRVERRIEEELEDIEVDARPHGEIDERLGIAPLENGSQDELDPRQHIVFHSSIILGNVCGSFPSRTSRTDVAEIIRSYEIDPNPAA